MSTTLDEDTRRRACRLIAGLVVADSDLSPEEDVFVDRMLARFGIPQEDRASIFPILDEAEAAAEVRSLPADVQAQVLDLLIQAAAADRQIVDEERSYVQAVGKVIGADPAELDRRLDAAAAAAR
ncbi:MAG: hypothetical protein U0359_19660 [Byssovorax sp.]